MKHGALVGVFIAFSQPVVAGEFTLQGGTDTAVIVFSGSVEIGDLKKFQSVSENVRNATVILSSPGGRLAEGLKIGDAIRRKGYTTKVVGGSVCASACGFMWLAGRERVVEGDGKVGFHAAYKGDSDYTVSASGNAVAGAYMARLGLNDFVITYATEAAPREMRWLTPRDAKFLGLDVSWISPSPAVSSLYPMTRSEIEDDVISIPKLHALKHRFPKVYAQIIDMIYEAQAHGENWEEAYRLAFRKLPQFNDELFRTSPDSELVELFGVNLSYLRYLQKHDPSMCASYGFPEFFQFDRFNYFGGMPAAIQIAQDKAVYALLTGPTLPARTISSADVRYQNRKITQITSQLVPKFSIPERRRIGNMKKYRDAKLACKFTVALFGAIQSDTKLVSLTLRSGTLFK